MGLQDRTAAYRSLWYARFDQGSATSLPKVMALHRRGSISHTGWSFDWNNPSMNYLYHRTFLCLVRYVHKVGIRGKNQKFPRLRNWYGIINSTVINVVRRGNCFNERNYYNTGTAKRFTIKFYIWFLIIRINTILSSILTYRKTFILPRIYHDWISLDMTYKITLKRHHYT